jgi:hypothetical protein
MPIIFGTLARYFGLRFLTAVLVVFAGIFALVALIDYIELMRRAGDIPNVSATLVAKTSFYRVPQVVERIPDRRYVVLSRSVAAPGTGGRPLCWGVGMAIRHAGSIGGLRLRHRSDRNLQPDLRDTPGALQAFRV